MNIGMKQCKRMSLGVGIRDGHGNESKYWNETTEYENESNKYWNEA